MKWDILQNNSQMLSETMEEGEEGLTVNKCLHEYMKGPNIY